VKRGPTTTSTSGRGVTVDVGGDGHIVGLEIHDASKRLAPGVLSSITIRRLPAETTTS
jgi:uncharacterized protein YuzE